MENYQTREGASKPVIINFQVTRQGTSGSIQCQSVDQIRESIAGIEALQISIPETKETIIAKSEGQRIESQLRLGLNKSDNQLKLGIGVGVLFIAFVSLVIGLSKG